MTRRTVRPRYQLTAAAITALLLFAVPFGPFQATPIDAARKCLKLATWHNQARRVGRPVNVECSGFHAGDDHRGNWGLDSWVSDPTDGFQFPGWDRRDGWLTWQSCTDEYPPPDSANYNNPQSPAYTTQIAVPDNDTSYGYDAERGPEGATCESINQGVYTFHNEYMALYELDSPDDDDHVGTLYFGTVNVPVECRSAWDCEGSSPWKWPNQPGSADNAEADHQIRVYLW